MNPTDHFPQLSKVIISTLLSKNDRSLTPAPGYNSQSLHVCQANEAREHGIQLKLSPASAEGMKTKEGKCR
jgi:hypothetical protein